MAGKPGRRPKQVATTPTGPTMAKITIRISDLTAKRLAVEAVMSGVSQSQIADRVLGAYLSGWRLPSKVGTTPDPAGNTENVA